MRIFSATICFVFVQTCWSQSHIQYGVRDRSYLSPQFLSDMKIIADNFHRNVFVTETINRLMGKLIEVTRIPNRQLDMGMIKAIADETNEIEQDENTVILEYFLSTKLAPANYMGILILMQAIRPSATSAQRHDAIEYLYGLVTLKFPNDISVNIHSNCSWKRRMNLTALNSLVKIEARVIEDIINITNTFSCNPHIVAYIDRTVQQLTVDLDGTNRVIDIRDMKSYSYSLEELDIQDYYSRTIDKAESIVSTRLPIGRYKNLIKFSRSCLLGAKDEAFQDVHDYLYGCRRGNANAYKCV